MGQQWMSILGWLACSDVRSKEVRLVSNEGPDKQSSQLATRKIVIARGYLHTY
jgi:hypothetical protein